MDETERIVEQGKALVRAIEALETTEPTGPIERVMTWLLLKAYPCSNDRRKPQQACPQSGTCSARLDETRIHTGGQPQLGRTSGC